MKKTKQFLFSLLLVSLFASCSGEGFSLLTGEPPFLANEFTIAKSEATGNTTVKLTFNKPIDPATFSQATVTVDNGLSVLSSAAGSMTEELVLTTSPQKNIKYAVSVTGLTTPDGEKLTGGTAKGAFIGYNTFVLTKIENLGNTTVRLTFNLPVSSTSIDASVAAGGYSLDNGLSVTTATAGSNSQEVMLTTTAQTKDTEYTLKISKLTTTDGEGIKNDEATAIFKGKNPVQAKFLTKPVPFGNDVNFSFTLGGDYGAPANYRFKIVKWDGSAESDVVGATITSPVTSWPSGWSSDAVISSAIAGTLPNTGAGQKDIYRIYAIVEDSYGTWQSVSTATMYEWAVDNAAPEAAKFTDKPTSPTNFTAVSISVGDLLCSETSSVHPCNDTGDVVYYKYAVTSDGGTTWLPADWASATQKNVSENIILTGLEDGKTYKVRMIVADFAENWQTNTGPGDDAYYTTANPTQEYSFTVDTVAPIAEFLSGLPPQPNNSLNTILIKINTADADKYKYKLTGPNNTILEYKGDWSPELDPATTDISETNLASAGAGNYTLLVVAQDAAGNWQDIASATEYSWNFDPNEPTAELNWNGSPPNFRTKETDYTITVGGVGITHYKYAMVIASEGATGQSCVGAVYGSETAIATDIALTVADFPTADRNYTLCVVGKNTDGTWQSGDDTKVTKRTWAYDTSAPTASIAQWVSPSSQPTNTTISSFTFLVGGTDPRPGETPATVSDAVEYKYNVVTNGDCTTGSYSTVKGIGTAVALSGLSYGTNSICLLVRDSAGNWQIPANATKTDIVILATPTPSRPAEYVYPSGASKNFTFNWANPSGVADVKIQIAKDSGFANVVPGYTVGKTLGAVTTHTYPETGDVSAGIGTTFYARLMIKDSLGNWSAWGSASDGVTVTGGLTGTVRDVNGAVVNGATVTLKTKDGLTTLGTKTTNASGVYEFSDADNIPITTASNGYQVAVSSGTAVGSKTQISVSPGTVSDAGTVYIVDPGTIARDIIGKVASAEDGTLVSLSNVSISLYKWDGTLITNSYTAEDGGIFRFSSVAGGSYYITVEKPGYYSFTKDGIYQTGTGEVNVGTVPLSPTFTTGSKEIKVVLIWNNQIDDLDLHVVGPKSGGGNVHVYYLNRVFVDSGGSSSGTTQLALDTTMYYGPEVINFREGFAAGTYKFSVQKFSQATQQWVNGRVQILVYAGDYYTGSSGGLLYTFSPSVPSSGQEAYATWKAFTMTVSGTTLSFNANGVGDSRTTDEFVNFTNADVSGSVSYDAGVCGANPVPCVANDSGLTNLNWTW